MKKKFAIVLSGCGVYDGSEIHEAVAAMLAIAKNGAEYQIFAPHTNQLHAINHCKGEPANEQRNVMIESARIARGDIKPLSEFNANDYDVLFFPGGFGAMKNLCTFAVDGINCSVNNDVESAIKSMHQAKKVIGAMCIAPVLLARVLGNVSVTIGLSSDESVSGIEHFGGTHVEKNAAEVCIDSENKILTTPAYMRAACITEVFESANNLVSEILKMI